VANTISAQPVGDATEPRDPVEGISARLFETLISKLSEPRTAINGIVLFPDGIQLIDVSVTIQQNSARVTLRGDKVKAGSLTDNAAEERERG
jgi:hypothetical protein